MSDEAVELAAPAAAGENRPRPWTVFASTPFRRLWAATLLSLFGDFFSYVALAWLVLQLTGSGFALGTVLLVQSLPRVVLMAVGGAISDRISARLTMLGSMGLRFAFVAPLAVLVLTSHVHMWEIYGIGLVFGVVDAFFLPARSAILPRIVADHELEPGNAVLNVTAQSAVILGPVVGGLVVAAFGTGWAFAADAACFALGFVFVVLLPAPPAAPSRTATGEAHGLAQGLARQIGAGLRYAWNDVGLRIVLIFIAVIDFAANGAIGVGIPTLAHSRFAGGATGLGVLLGAWGVGATAGALGAGFKAPPRRFGLLVVFISAWLGACTFAVGLMPSLPAAATCMGIAGIGTGVVNTYGISWMQRRTPAEMQGRVMSLVMLASAGLTPIAYALSGPIADFNLTLLFAIAGGMMLACAVAAMASRQVRALR